MVNIIHLGWGTTWVLSRGTRFYNLVACVEVGDACLPARNTWYEGKGDAHIAGQPAGEERGSGW